MVVVSEIPDDELESAYSKVKKSDLVSILCHKERELRKLRKIVGPSLRKPPTEALRYLEGWLASCGCARVDREKVCLEVKKRLDPKVPEGFDPKY